MSVSTFLSYFLCMLAYYLRSFRKMVTENTWMEAPIHVISYEPTCSHKQCDRIGAITKVPILYIPLYKGLYTLRVNLLTKSHLATKYPLVIKCTHASRIKSLTRYMLLYICNKYKSLVV